MKLGKDTVNNKYIALIEGDIPAEILDYEYQLTQPYSEITFTDAYVVKRSKVQKFADYTRKVYRSQAKREYISTSLMDNIGIKTPKVYGYAVYLNPFSAYDSILLMERVENIGTMADIFKSKIERYHRKIMFENFKRDLKSFIDNGIYHRDAHFNNILITKDYETVWIDNDISALKGNKERVKFLSKFIKRDFLSESEKEIISSIILK